MQDEVQQGAAASESAIPEDFRAYESWRRTGELPKAEDTSVAGEAGNPPPESDPEEGKQEQPRDESGKFKGKDDLPESVQKRINKEIARAAQARREAEEYAAQLRERATRESAPETKQPPAQTEAEGRPAKPERSKYDTYDAYETAYEKYVEDLADWKYQANRKQDEQREVESRARRQAQETLESWSGRVEAARKAHSDFDDVMGDAEIPLSPALQQTLVESEHGAELAYALAKDPDLAARIVKLSPLSQVKELGKLEATIVAKTAAPEDKKPAISKAPKPPQTVSGTSTGAVDIYSEKTSFKDYERARREQLSRK